MLVTNGPAVIARWVFSRVAAPHKQWGGGAHVVALMLLVLLAPTSPLATAQTTPAEQPVVRVMADGHSAITLDRATLATMPRVNVTAAAHHEPPSHWQGVALQSILQKVGAPTGEQLRGHAMTTVVRVTASDHYQIVFSLAELDPMLGNEQALLADTQDGHPITKDGPFRIVVPNDKRPARWIHNVTTIEVINIGTSSR